MKLAVLLLCLEPPEQLALRISSPFYRNAEVKLYIHYDAQRSAAELKRLKSMVPEWLRVRYVKNRVHCRWGEYSLVEATHRLLRSAIEDPDFEPDYLALISGSCMPIRPFASFQEFLRRRQGIDFIQAVDISQRSWVRGGLERERFEYHFPFNFQTHRWAFEKYMLVQRRLGLLRKPPEDLRVHFGSQWFCLTRDTAAAVTARLEDRRLKSFFERSWIPDEFAIQTLVANTQKPAFISGYNLTYYEFDDQGRPLVLDNGHREHLMRQPYFFARKISPEATQLTLEIADHVAGREYDLSYFNRAGQSTNDYQRFLARALTVRTVRSHVGTAEDAWRGMMDYSSRRYFVLYAASNRYLEHLLRAVRKGSDLPLFDFIFAPPVLVAASEMGSWRGVQSGMRARRDYDPGAFLHEVVSIDPKFDTAFAINPAIPCWARNFVLWDPNATLICCDPPDMSKQQLAEAELREMSAASDADLLMRTVDAATVDQKWLPQAHYSEAIHEGKHTCRAMRLQVIPVDDGNPKLAALKAAVVRVDWWQFYARPDQAQARLRHVQPQGDALASS